MRCDLCTCIDYRSVQLLLPADYYIVLLVLLVEVKVQNISLTHTNSLVDSLTLTLLTRRLTVTRQLIRTTESDSWRAATAALRSAAFARASPCTLDTF